MVSSPSILTILHCFVLSQALESEAVQGRFRAVYEKMNSALDGMPYSELAISDEVKEQVNLPACMFLPA